MGAVVTGQSGHLWGIYLCTHSFYLGFANTHKPLCSVEVPEIWDTSGSLISSASPGCHLGAGVTKVCPSFPCPWGHLLIPVLLCLVLCLPPHSQPCCSARLSLGLCLARSLLRSGSSSVCEGQVWLHLIYPWVKHNSTQWTLQIKLNFLGWKTGESMFLK